MDPIRLGIIGVGNMGKNHVRVARELRDDYVLAGVYDPDSSRVEQLGLTEIACDSEEMLMQRCDAVVVASPSSLHKKIGLLAAANDVHLLMEKPLALSETDAAALVDAMNDSGKVLMVDHVERFNPVVQELAKILAQEDIQGIEIERCSPMDLRISDTDVIYDLMIHDVDILLNAIVPTVNYERLEAFGKKTYSSSYVDYVQALFQFDNGVVASVISSRTTESKIRNIRVHCATSYMDADLLNRTLSIARKTQYSLDVGYDPRYSQENIIERVFVPNVEPLRESLKHFATCIRDNHVPITGGLASLKSLRALDAIKEKVYGR